MKVNDHVLIKNNSNPHPFILCNGKTGTIVHLKTLSKTAQIRLDNSACETFVSIRTDNLIVIPHNVYTEWNPSLGLPNFVIIGRHNKPYFYLVCSNYNYLIPAKDFTNWLLTNVLSSNDIKTDSYVSSIKIFKVYQSIDEIANRLNEHRILMVNDTQHSLCSVLRLY